jgi:sec-independent protein translocase protein TatC
MSNGSDNKEDELAGTEQPFVSHLVELRDRMIHALYGLVAAVIVLAIWPGPTGLLDLLAMLIAVGVFSPFFIPLKVLFMAGFLLALPWLIYQAWMFIAPGLYKHEKRFALPLIFFGSALAYAGIAFVQLFVLDKMFFFLQKFAPASVAATPDVASYVEAVLGLYIAFAAAFQVPIVVILLVKVGLVTVKQLTDFRGYFIVVAFIVAAVITPPDVVSQLALAIPMCLLYEAGIWAARFFVKKKEDEPQAEAGKAT